MIDLTVPWQAGLFGLGIAVVFAAVVFAVNETAEWVSAVWRRSRRTRREHVEARRRQEEKRLLGALVDALAEGNYRRGLRG